MNENKFEVLLDVIPIYKNEMYPTKDMIWHYRTENIITNNKEVIYESMINDIRKKFWDCDCVIILDDGKVIEVLKGEK